MMNESEINIAFWADIQTFISLLGGPYSDQAFFLLHYCLAKFCPCIENFIIYIV
jgi:hypothetical protein